MAKHYQKKLRPGPVPNPAAIPLSGLRPMRRPPVDSAQAGQDRIAPLSRRVLCTGGLQGQGWHSANSSTPRQSFPQIFPLADTPRTCADAYLRLTPGCFPALRVIYMLSGPCEVDTSPVESPGTDYTREHAAGLLRATIIYTKGAATSTITREYVLEASQLRMGSSGSTISGAEPEDDGGGWGALRELEVPPEDLMPDDSTDGPSELAKWNWCIAEIKIEVECGARIVDCCCYEIPVALAFEADDPAPPVHARDGAAPSDGLSAGRFPVQRASETTPDGDPRLGTWWMADVAEQISQTGPTLWNWHAWDESSASPALQDVETDFETTSTTFVAMPSPGSDTYDQTAVAFRVSSPGYARRHGLSDERIVLPNAAAIPVRVSVLGKVDTGTGTVRVQTGIESYVDITIDQTSIDWHTQTGYLRVGVNPDDETYGQQFAKKETSGTLTVRAVSVVHDAFEVSIA